MRNKIFENPENYTKEAMRKRFMDNYRKHWKKDPDKLKWPMSFKTETFFIVGNAAYKATSKDEFIELMGQQGYHVRWDDNHKYISFFKEGHQSISNKSFYPQEAYTKEALEEKFKKNKKRLKEIRSGKYEAKDIGELQKLDRLFLLFSIIEGFKGNSYPHQTNLQEYSARAIDEWQREEEKGHGMDWER